MESLSAYARQFLGRLDKPDVDLIEGLSPAISIEQKATSHNPRSTVGTVTEIHDYLRLLWPARARRFARPRPAAGGADREPDGGRRAGLPGTPRLMILAPVARKKGEFTELFAQMQALGYIRFRVDGQIYEHENLPQLKKTEKHDIDVVIDRVKVRADLQQRLAESIEAALRGSGGHEGNGRVLALEMDTGQEHLFSSKFACPVCSYSLAELEPRLFSFNSPMGCLPGVRRPGPARGV